jgi:hypothetical protein
MDQEIASAINRAHFHQQPVANISIINANSNVKCVITAISHPNATAAMAQQYCEMMKTAARTADKVVFDVEQNESWKGRRSMQYHLYGTWEMAQKACTRYESNSQRKTKV